jgi:hypothetical protein
MAVKTHRRGYARHPLFGFAGKRGLKSYHLLLITF